MLLLLALPAAAGDVPPRVGPGTGDHPTRDLVLGDEIEIMGTGMPLGCVLYETRWSRFNPLIALPRDFNAEMAESLSHVAPLELVEEPEAR